VSIELCDCGIGLYIVLIFPICFISICSFKKGIYDCWRLGMKKTFIVGDFISFISIYLLYQHLFFKKGIYDCWGLGMKKTLIDILHRLIFFSFLF
jgi:hypothetical protein